MRGNKNSRDEIARSYADRHLKTDPGIREVYYLPTKAPGKEIRLVEVNELMVTREDDPLEPIDFGVDVGGNGLYSLMVVDVTPAQWEKITKNELHLPKNWTVKGAIQFSR
jgi:hypothetical protein